uniref:Uncharacterized protein n=1 Tax=Brassica oleracea TaxID=3712 RepID=A0A3P6GES4_BRAOL|nr:unnamed protein product [Brassica oleracea]
MDSLNANKAGPSQGPSSKYKDDYKVRRSTTGTICRS